MGGRIIRLVVRGGNLTVTIPRALVRELQWVKGEYVVLWRDALDGLHVSPATKLLKPYSADPTRPGRAYPPLA